VHDENLLGIGSFSQASGLSIHALRHYDEVGLLKPASVDPGTGYRRYRPGQVGQARLICALRQVDLPIDLLRETLDDPANAALGPALTRHRETLADRARTLSRIVRLVDQYLDQGGTVPEVVTRRISQVTINVTDLPEATAFYRAAFDAAFNENISSFLFGIWPGDDFFLLTVAFGPDESGRQHKGPTGTSRFGLSVADVDETHRRALEAGATEYFPPEDMPWKPRSSCVIDPSGNWIDLYQG
jgi:DNA-binding transcriptional MerR regulator